jgi:hypothetical protein
VLLLLTVIIDIIIVGPVAQSVRLLAGRSGDRVPVGARFFAPVQTGPGAHPVSCTMGTGYFPGVKRPGRGADHPHFSSAKVTKGYSYACIHSLGLFRPVTGLLYPHLRLIDIVSNIINRLPTACRRSLCNVLVKNP